ncbi:MAG: asparagine synthase-related protein [Halioglobus sp.]|nr:asparagine synthase-related protein [Halioglobus sp.]
MTRTDQYNTAAAPLRRHGIAGLYMPGQPALSGSGHVGTAGALQTAIPVSCAEGEDFGLAATGDSCPLPGGGAVALAGRPRFEDKALHAIANEAGTAAAVAHGYAEHGDSVFRLMRGGFACCIIDRQASRFLAAVDRMGQHAFYYLSLPGGGVAFGTEAGAAMACAGRQATLERQGVYNYIYFHMVPSPGTAFAGLKKLPAGHFLDFSGNHCQTVNYWQPQFQESTADSDFDTLCNELRQVLRLAVQNNRPDTGKVGAFLSGGLDSSTVTGVLSELEDSTTEAYAIGFAAEGYDEIPFARITAKHFGVHLNEYYVTPEDVVDALPLIATSYDEPFGNSSALPAYFCARMAAKNGIQTLLAGDGGDEIFAGNERYTWQRVFEHYSRIPVALRRGLIEPLLRLLPANLPMVSKARSYVAQANTPLPDRMQSYNFLHRHAATEIFTDDFLAGVDTDLPLDLLRTIYHRPRQTSDLHRMLYLDWQITLADNDLRKVSHMCAVAGVDVTYPMLDDALVEFACRVPAQWKAKGGELRHFYKQALRDWLPQETISKNKKGFGLPFGIWMQTYQPLREMAYDSLLQLKQRGFIQPAFIDKAIKMHQSEHAAYYGELVWIFTIFELWLAGSNVSSDDLLKG